MLNILKQNFMEEDRGILGGGASSKLGKLSSMPNMDIMEKGIINTLQELMTRIDAGSIKQLNSEEDNSGKPCYSFYFISENRVFESHKDFWNDSHLGIVVRLDSKCKKIETIQFSTSFFHENYGDEITVSRQFQIDMDLSYFVDKGYLSIIIYYTFFKDFVKNFSIHSLL